MLGEAALRSGLVGLFGLVGWWLGGGRRGVVRLVLDQIAETGGIEQVVAGGAQQGAGILVGDGRQPSERSDVRRIDIRERAARLRLSYRPVDERRHARAFGDGGVEA